MQSTLVSLVLSGFGRDALKAAAGLALVVLMASAFVLSTLLAVIQAAAGAVLRGPIPAEVAAFGAPAPVGQNGGAPHNRLAANYPRTAPDGALPPASGPVAEAVLTLARSQLGRPYVWGGASPQTSFDCSGLVQWAYRQTGISVPRTAQQQFNAAAPVSQDRLEPGDLVFFEKTYFDPRDSITHVGIYAGNGLMVNAESAGVSVSPVFSGYFGAHYAGAGRVLAADRASAATTGGR